MCFSHWTLLKDTTSQALPPSRELCSLGSFIHTYIYICFSNLVGTWRHFYTSLSPNSPGGIDINPARSCMFTVGWHNMLACESKLARSAHKAQDLKRGVDCPAMQAFFLHHCHFQYQGRSKACLALPLRLGTYLPASGAGREVTSQQRTCCTVAYTKSV